MVAISSALLFFVGAYIINPAEALADTDASGPAASPSEVVVRVAGEAYRVQALSPTLLRIEAEGPSGTFENRSTFFAQNRSWPGVPITVRRDGPNSSTLSTPNWTLELSAAGAPDTIDSTPAAALANRGTSSVASGSCGNALEGGEVSAGVKLSTPPPPDAAAGPTTCCAACDATADCTAWLWVPAAPAPPAPHGGGGGKGPLRAAPCDSERAGQIWKLAGKRGDNGWTSIESGNGKNGCWEITGCATSEGAHVGTNYGCKPVPNPGYSNNCAANGAWSVHDNGTITSVIDGHCLSLGSDKQSLEVNTCIAGSKEQQWIFDKEWTKPGSGKPSSVRSAITVADADGGICIDNGPKSVQQPPAPLTPTSSCELYSSVTSIKSGGHNTVLGGIHPATTYQPGRGCAATLRSADGSGVLWSSPSFGAAAPELNAPAPSLVSNTTVLAVLDAPRFVPPAWGATPPPSYVHNAASLPHANTSGFDLTNHADDLYLFISTANHAEGLASIRQEFLELSGRIPLLPQWAFGLCESRFCQSTNLLTH